jgi:uncharacterized RDD family membrane protein YckC
VIRYQTIEKRIGAALIDALVFAPVIALSFWVNSADTAPIWVHYLFLIGSSAIGLGYNALLHWRYGQTLGKMVVKVKVVDAASERPITFFQAFIRDIAYALSSVVDISIVIILVSSGHPRLSDTVVNAQEYALVPLFVWMALDSLVFLKTRKHRALHDFIAGTVVVRTDVPSDDPIVDPFHNPPSPGTYPGLLGE